MRVFVVLISVLILSGCGKDFIFLTPRNDIPVSKFYKTASEAKEAVLACYSNLQSVRYYGETYAIFTELASDDATHKDFNISMDEFTWQPNSTGFNLRFDYMWLHFYQGVQRANLVLDKVPSIEMNESEKNKILGEAYFFRGFNYWQLAVVFGGAPIITKTPQSIDELYLERKPVNEVFAQAEADLIKATQLLPENWPSADQGRLTKYAAYAMLGKVYMHWVENGSAKWQQAYDAFKVVIDSKKYSLMPNFEQVINRNFENNAESIFEIQFTDRGNGSGGFNGFIDDIGVGNEGSKRDLIFGMQNVAGQRGFGEIIGTNEAYRSFEIGDPRWRLTFWRALDTCLTGYDDKTGQGVSCAMYNPRYGLIVKTGGNAGEDYLHIRKGVSGFINTAADAAVSSPINWPVIRLADVYLLHAEACAELGLRSEAFTYINEVRKRARGGVSGSIPRIAFVNYDFSSNKIADSIVWVKTLPDLPTTDPVYTINGEINGEPLDYSGGDLNSMRQIIVNERRSELMFEYIRFLDMRRWERIDKNHPGAAEKVFKSKVGVNKKAYNSNIHSLCPIPQKEIDLSQNKLVQNPGY